MKFSFVVCFPVDYQIASPIGHPAIFINIPYHLTGITDLNNAELITDVRILPTFHVVGETVVDSKTIESSPDDRANYFY
jgi:hypothetical protein